MNHLDNFVQSENREPEIPGRLFSARHSCRAWRQKSVEREELLHEKYFRLTV
jgi:uncharacterized protein YjiS (DUF1127 family)